MNHPQDRHDSQTKANGKSVTLITGASSGIGLAIARQLAAENHPLILAARRLDALEALIGELGPNAQAIAVQTDLRNPQAIAQLVERGANTFGSIDVLINNAGVGESHLAYAATDEQINFVMETNFAAPLRLTRLVAPHMIARKRGHIINIASVTSYVATPKSSLYAASKHALKGWNDALRRELLPTGVKVSLVCPGFIRTPMTADLRIPMPGPEAVAKAVSRLIRHPRREIFVPGIYRWFTTLTQLAPAITDAMLSRFDRSKLS